MRTLLLLPLLALVAACGDDLSSHKGVAEAKADAYNDLAGVLDGIKDKASAEAAKPKVEAIMKRINAADEAAMKITAELNIKDMEEVGKRIEAAEKRKMEALMKLMDRIKNDPEAQAAFDKMMSSIR